MERMKQFVHSKCGSAKDKLLPPIISTAISTADLAQNSLATE